MATHTNILAWEIPQAEDGRLLSLGSQRVRYDCAHMPIGIVEWGIYTQMEE